jgi:hypothetical protein
MTDADLTAIYNEANGVAEGKRPAITTQRIFAAMRLVAAKERERCAKVCETWPNGREERACAAAIREMK